MRVVITGANSAVGQAILRCGAGERTKQGAESITFVAAVRSERAAEEVRPLLGEADTVARISYDDATSLRAAFEGASAVIHLAGILIERRSSTYEQANVATTRSVVDAAKQSGVEKIVFVSATGASETSSNRYWKSKGQAEALVRSSGLSYTVLRVPLLLGAGTEGSAALKRNASGRKAKLIGGGRALQQPLCVDDLALAAIAAAQTDVARNRTLELVGPVSLPESELVKRASRQLGNEVRIGSIPKKLIRCALIIRQFVAGPGFSPDALDVITADTRLDPLPAAGELGIELTRLDEMIKSSLD
jgi:NADH dehydrogenase